MLDTRERDKYLAARERKVLELKPETIAFLRECIARCDKASEYLTSSIAHDKQCFIDEMQNADRCLCQAVGKLLKDAE